MFEQMKTNHKMQKCKNVINDEVCCGKHGAWCKMTNSKLHKILSCAGSKLSVFSSINLQF